MGGPAGRLDVALVCAGRWHDFDHARLQLLTLLAEDPRVRTRVFEDYALDDVLDRTDLLITYTCDRRPTPQQQQQLVTFVSGGGRWLALHGTNAAIDPPEGGRDGQPTGVYRTPRVLGMLPVLLGSQFLGHPPITPYLVEVSAPDHPLVTGVEPFTVADELYVSELHPPLEVLLHTRWSGAAPGFAEGDTTDDEPRPVLYLKRTGQGCVCYLTLGHCRGRHDVQDLGVDDLGRTDRGSWELPAFQQVLRRCVRWGLDGSFEAA